MSEHIEAWLSRIESKLDSLAPLPAKMDAIGQRLDDHIEKDEHLFNGNGSPGLVKDVDRLKQWQKSIFWWVGIAVASPVLAEAAKLAADALSK